MPPLDRLYSLHRLLHARRTAVGLDTLQTELECSRATVYRTINLLRDHFGAPVERDAALNGYRYTDSAFELPGLWFTAGELLSCTARPPGRPPKRSP